MAAPSCLARQIPVCTVRRADKCPYVVLRDINILFLVLSFLYFGVKAQQYFVGLI